MEYILVLTATLLFSSQFLMTQIYSKRAGTGLKATFSYNIGVYTVIAIYMFVANGLKLQITPFSLLIALITSANILIGNYASIAALNVANLSLYSVFMMSGPVVISSLVGFLFFSEKITLGVIIGIALIGVSLYLSIDRNQKSSKGAIKYYFICFFSNGLSGTIAKIHQDNTAKNVPSNDFLILYALTTIALSTVLLLIITKGKNPFENFKSLANLGAMTGYAAFNGIAELLSLITLALLPVSLQQPLVTGGVLTFSFIIALLRREKMTPRSAIAFIAALAATISISLLTKPII